MNEKSEWINNKEQIPTASPSLQLHQERQYYLTARNDLMARLYGKWVAILGNEVLASGETRWDVIQQVARLVGKRPVLIEQVMEPSFVAAHEVVELATPCLEQQI